MLYNTIRLESKIGTNDISAYLIVYKKIINYKIDFTYGYRIITRNSTQDCLHEKTLLSDNCIDDHISDLSLVYGECVKLCNEYADKYKEYFDNYIHYDLCNTLIENVELHAIKRKKNMLKWLDGF